MTSTDSPRASATALLPLVLFLGLFFGVGLYHQLNGTDYAFYQLKSPVAILPALALSVWLGRERLEETFDTLLRGIGDKSIILMCLIYLLAGAFSTVMEAIGGVAATVNLGLAYVPSALLLPGLFVISAFVATAMGTSMGTVAAVAPIAVGLSTSTDLSTPLTVGTVIGGAMFGDNLSVISDTTIAATRTQGCSMRDKFRANVAIAVPAALVTVVGLGIWADAPAQPTGGAYTLVQVLPYLAVLGLAVAGLNVLIVLSTGLVLAGGVGLWAAGYGLGTYAKDIYAGFESMIEIMLLSMLIGGLGALMKQQGGLQWITNQIVGFTRRVAGKDPRAGELGIGALGALGDALTANNTVSILLAGDVARSIAERHNISPARSASMLDIFACVMQGSLPYGAQFLLAGSIAGLSPLALVGTVHYTWILGLFTLGAIFWGFPKRYAAVPASTVPAAAEAS
ncbi:Na+/H+ antiporter NhaC family protein [Salisaeta longa]|uniref:Na+/H+ antiporter NhaC family protein n=1 Tax=Salisaeta longa TaxID=503170 RepID=UPI0003B4E395|nr:Na+/H+ antiporter NhaC family protein [Salisaeta longa]